MPENAQPTPGEIAVMAGGGAMLIGSFLSFYEISVLGFSSSWNGWSNAFNLFPLSVIVTIVGVIFGLDVALRRFGHVTFPDRLTAITRGQFRLTIAILLVATAAGYALRDFGFGVDRGIGVWLWLAGAVAILVGVIVMQRDDGSVVPYSTPPPRVSVAESPGTIVVLVAAAAVVVGSFLDFYGSESAWSSGLLPLMTLPALAAFVVGGHAALTAFSELTPPARLLGTGWTWLYWFLAGYATLLMVCFLVSEASFSGRGADRGIGFWLMLLGSIAMVVGTALRMREHTPGAGPA
jgi:hypothetical protein